MHSTLAVAIDLCPVIVVLVGSVFASLGYYRIGAISGACGVAVCAILLVVIEAAR